MRLLDQTLSSCDVRIQEATGASTHARQHSQLKESIIVKNRNTFAKQQRAVEKKRKAEEKRQRRIARKAEDSFVESVDSTREPEDTGPSDESNADER